MPVGIARQCDAEDCGNSYHTFDLFNDYNTHSSKLQDYCRQFCAHLLVTARSKRARIVT
jgi:hypothetical protein